MKQPLSFYKKSLCPSTLKSVCERSQDKTSQTATACVKDHKECEKVDLRFRQWINTTAFFSEQSGEAWSQLLIAGWLLWLCHHYNSVIFMSCHSAQHTSTISNANPIVTNIWKSLCVDKTLYNLYRIKFT